MKHIMYKTLKILLKALYYVLILLCIVLVLIIVMQKISDSNKSIAGYRIFVVVSGSMEPKYGVGEVVICKEVEPEKIKIGDAIVYRGNTGELNGLIIMHEIVDIYYNDQNELKIHAKGIANNRDDPEISTDQVYGIVKGKSDILTLLYSLALNKKSAFIIIIFLILNVFLAFRSPKKREIDNNELDNNVIKGKEKQDNLDIKDKEE